MRQTADQTSNGLARHRYIHGPLLAGETENDQTGAEQRIRVVAVALLRRETLSGEKIVELALGSVQAA